MLCAARCVELGEARREKDRVAETRHEGEESVESRQRNVRDAAAAGSDRQIWRVDAVQSLACGANYVRRFQKSSRRASDCVGRGSSRLPAAGVAVKIFDRFRRDRSVSWSRYAVVRGKAAGWRALEGWQTST